MRRARRHQDRLILELDGVETCDRAENLRSHVIWIARDRIGPLDSKRWFVQDILGVEVFTDEGERLGKADRGHAHAGERRLRGARGTGREILLPAIEDVIKDVDVAAGRMLVHLIEGLR